MRIPDFRDPVGRVRAVGMVEGVSFLLLMGVAMPMKYLADMPLAVTYVGWAHGVLFITFLHSRPTGLDEGWLKAGWC